MAVTQNIKIHANVLGFPVFVHASVDENDNVIDMDAIIDHGEGLAIPLGKDWYPCEIFANAKTEWEDRVFLPLRELSVNF